LLLLQLSVEADTQVELRLAIYTHLLLTPSPRRNIQHTSIGPVPLLVGASRVAIDARHGTLFEENGRPGLTILATCRQIHAEGTEFFYSHHSFELFTNPEDCFEMSGLPLGRIFLPEKHLRLPLLTNLKILVRVDLMGPGSFIDLGRPMQKLPGLRKLCIGFVFARRAYMRRDNAERWMESSAVGGLICRITRETPRDVELCWGVWSELRDQMLVNEVGFRNLGFLDGRMLEEMSQIYEPLRGTLSGAGSLFMESLDN
jgi:hypothetical protein